MAGINGYSGFLSNIVQGDTKDFRITVSLNGVPVDITGCRFYLTFAPDKDITSEPTLEIELTDFVSPEEGVALGSVSDTQTAALPVGALYYSLRYVTAEGKTYILDMGKITCLPGISSRIA